jgi:hypothetical protein
MAAGRPVGLPSYLDTDDEPSNKPDDGLLSNSSIIMNQTKHFGIGLEALRPRISRVTENVSPMPQKSQVYIITIIKHDVRMHRCTDVRNIEKYVRMMYGRTDTQTYECTEGGCADGFTDLGIV